MAQSSLLAYVRERLAPNGCWELSPCIGQLLARRIAKLPKSDVSDAERRYPTTPAGMRAYLDAFFARHFFQIQESLLDSIVSSMEAITRAGTMSFVDIGSGPAVASLAVLDLLETVLSAYGQRSNDVDRPVQVGLVLNDANEYCLGLGRELLKSYDRAEGRSGDVRLGHVATVSTPFPESLTQLRRMAVLLQPFNLVSMGYVLRPLDQQIGARGIADAVRNLGSVCSCDGAGIHIVQDRYREDLMRDIGGRLGARCQEHELHQRVYDSDNPCKEFTYCFYHIPVKGGASSCLARVPFKRPRLDAAR